MYVVPSSGANKVWDPKLLIVVSFLSRAATNVYKNEMWWRPQG